MSVENLKRELNLLKQLTGNILFITLLLKFINWKVVLFI